MKINAIQKDYMSADEVYVDLLSIQNYLDTKTNFYFYETDFDELSLMAAVDKLTTADLEKEYNLAIEKYLFTGNSSERILDYFLGEK